MSTTASGPATTNAGLSAYPDVELNWRFDDPDDPAEVTVFAPDAEDTTTRWITADVDSAVPIGETR